MKNHQTAIAWASAILATAWVSQLAGLSDAASFALVTTLSGVAVGALYRRNRAACR